MAFLASLPSLKPLADDLMKGQGGLLDAVAFGLQFQQPGQGEGEGAEPPSTPPTTPGAPGEGEGEGGEVPVDRGENVSLPPNVPGHPFTRRALFELELRNMYLADQLKKELDAYNAKREPAQEQFLKSMEQLGAAWTPKLQAAAMTGDPRKVRQLANDCSKQGRTIADKFFVQWRDATLEAWSAIKVILETYWVMSDGIVGRIFDQKGFEFAQQVRRISVKAALAPFAFDFMAQATGMAMGDIVCVMPADLAPPAPAAAQLKLQVPPREKPPCPLEGKKFGVGLGVVQFSVTCDGWELSGGEGLVGKVQHKFGSGETTLLVGVGANFDVHAGFAQAGGSLSGMVGVTFDGQGAPVDVVGELSAEAGAGLNPFGRSPGPDGKVPSTAGGVSLGELNVRISAVNGIHPEFTPGVGVPFP